MSGYKPDHACYCPLCRKRSRLIGWVINAWGIWLLADGGAWVAAHFTPPHPDLVRFAHAVTSLAWLAFAVTLLVLLFRKDKP